MKHIAAMLVVLVLGGCATAPTPFDEDSTLYPPPAGSRFTLKQELAIPAHSAHVSLQGGQLVSQSQLNLYQPHCRLDVQDVGELPQSVRPDEFVVSRVYRQNTEQAFLRAGPVRVRRVMNDGGPGYMTYRTVFVLKSARQPQVRQLSCEHWDKAALGNHLSLRQIRAALGDYFAVTLAVEAKPASRPAGKVDAGV